MADFNRDKLEEFLGAVRKYMQVRGPMSQKELAVLTEVGVSTMSRFLNQKTTEINPQLVAKIVAKLNIPMHEIIDFVEEEFADKFIRLVKFYKNEDEVDSDEPTMTDTDISSGEEYGRRKDDLSDAITGTFERGSGGTAQRSTTANINVGGRKHQIHFERSGADGEGLSLKEKLDRLTPRQKAYVMEFLNLDVEGRDLMVDLGNSLFRYLRQKGMNL